MSSIEIILILLLSAAIATTLAARIKVPVEIILLLGSLVISLIPGLPTINLQPHIIFILFLPPILYSAAYFTSWRDFVANKRPISLLAIGLVLSTMCAVAVTMKLFTDFSWPLSFLLGAIVSPTDASSAVSLVKKLGIPSRIITIIEGESLINDATALIAYRFALMALMTGTFIWWHAGLNFITAAIGGVIFGYCIGFLSARLYSWLDEPRAQNMFSLIIPYIAYLVAEHLGLSGVICVVTAGLYFARKFPHIASAESRRKAETVWELFIFAINGLIFILLGLQLPTVIQGLSPFTIGQLCFYAIIINIIIIAIRFMWVFPAAYIPRLLSPSLRRRDPIPPWSQLATLSWIGMRGILSLAAVMALPHLLPSGEPFPYRSLLILLTYSVILVTLLLPIFTLPGLVRIFKFEKDRQRFQEEAMARIAAAKAALNHLDRLSELSVDLKGYVNQLRKRYLRKISVLSSNLSDRPYSTLNKLDQKIHKLTKDLINAERQVIIQLRSNGTIHDEVFHKLEKELDLEELRLTTQRI
jgi:Na+/H+ antiporter